MHVMKPSWIASIVTACLLMPATTLAGPHEPEDPTPVDLERALYDIIDRLREQSPNGTAPVYDEIEFIIDEATQITEGTVCLGAGIIGVDAYLPDPSHVTSAIRKQVATIVLGPTFDATALKVVSLQVSLVAECGVFNEAAENGYPAAQIGTHPKSLNTSTQKWRDWVTA